MTVCERDPLRFRTFSCSLTVTPLSGHISYVSSLQLVRQSLSPSNGVLVAAGAVRVGEVLQLADGNYSPVVAIENVSSVGLYNPQTVDGNIAVDDVMASAYTTAVHPRVAHSALLAPLRFIYRSLRMHISVLDTLTRFISHCSNVLARVARTGPIALA